MEKKDLVLADVATFGLIAAVAALFGFSHLGTEVNLIGGIVCCISTVMTALSMTAKRLHPFR
jgi:hypothetical protein